MKTRTSAINNAVSAVLMILLAALLATTIGSQIYRYMNDKHDTQDAELTNINEDISFQGIIVRNETQITYSGSDIVSYVYPDGSKVSKGSAVAKIYSSKDAISAESRYRLLEEQIDILNRAQNPGTIDYVQPESISKKIDEYYRQLIECANAGSYDNFSSVKSDMSLVMNIYNIISGIADNYNEKISELQSEAETLRRQADSFNDTIKASKTGYFVSYCDGFEDKLNRDNVYSLNQSDIDDIINTASNSENNAPSNAVGKIFEEYTSSIVCVIENDTRVVEDAQLQLMLDSSDTIYYVTVDSVKPAEDEGKSIVVFSCDSLDEALVAHRVQSMRLIFDEYKGLKVPRTAIRFQGDQKGVYVIMGEEITFKRIEVIYEGDDFVLSMNTSDDDYLRLHDQILLEVVSEQDVHIENRQYESDGSEVSGNT